MARISQHLKTYWKRKAQTFFSKVLLVQSLKTVLFLGLGKILIKLILHFANLFNYSVQPFIPLVPIFVLCS